MTRKPSCGMLGRGSEDRSMFVTHQPEAPFAKMRLQCDQPDSTLDIKPVGGGGSIHSGGQLPTGGGDDNSDYDGRRFGLAADHSLDAALRGVLEPGQLVAGLHTLVDSLPEDSAA